jgi:quercetin dioxygenase-like cupin family protein
MCNEVRDLGWKFKMDVKGDSDLYVTKLTFDPGGQTGWHSHPGPSLVTVIEGTLTVYHDDCTFETFSAGESFTDLGCGDIHDVRNEGATEAIDVAVQIVPHGAPRRIDVNDPGCANVPACRHSENDSAPIAVVHRPSGYSSESRWDKGSQNLRLRE